MAKKGQKYRIFSREQKLKAVKMVIEDEKSLSEVERKYLGYKENTGTLNRWIVEYNQEGENNAFRKTKGLKKVEDKDEKLRYDILKKFNAFLKEEIYINSNSSKSLKKHIQSK